MTTCIWGYGGPTMKQWAKIRFWWLKSFIIVFSYLNTVRSYLIHSKCIKHIKSNTCTCIRLLSLKDRQMTNNFLFQFPCSQIYPKNYTGSIYIIAFTSSRCTIKYKTYVFKNHFKKSTFNFKPLCDRYNLYIIFMNQNVCMDDKKNVRVWNWSY